jgi:hypothetical protein
LSPEWGRFLRLTVVKIPASIRDADSYDSDAASLE